MLEISTKNFNKYQNFNKTSIKTPKTSKKHQKKIAKFEGTSSPSKKLKKTKQWSLKCSKNKRIWQRGLNGQNLVNKPK